MTTDATSHNAPIASAQLKIILQTALLAAGEPLTLERLAQLFAEGQRPSPAELRACLTELATEHEQLGEHSGLQLVELASGYCWQTKAWLAPWVKRLWEERPVRYSRALLETLALIAYRQPITRAEIEDIRGVAVSSALIKTLLEREWVRIVGHRDIPGKPALYATTRQFLDHFNLKNLGELPPLAEFHDPEKMNLQLTVELAPTVATAEEPIMASRTEPTADPAALAVLTLAESVVATHEPDLVATELTDTPVTAEETVTEPVD